MRNHHHHVVAGEAEMDRAHEEAMDAVPIHLHAGRLHVIGGDAEMQRAHEEAVDAIFNQRVKAHHHMQAYVSRKTGKTKWGELEMWPVHVSLNPSQLMFLPQGCEVLV